MIKRVINKILKSINNLPAQYKVALARILTGIIDSINLLNNEISKRPDSAEWNSNTKEIQFKCNGVVLPNMTISGANFIKDGMVDSVELQDDNLVITFNTDAGKSPISIPLKDISIEPLVEITYSELKTLRDNSQLTPGMQYRITDYQCTTTQEDTRSAGHQFDIIVIADDVNKLNENARACLHEGDTYFSTAGSKLEAWELKYSLDNDINKFAWADSINGKGVIYWMKDERYNECSYDFKNIQFKRYAITNIINTYPKTPTQILNKLNTLKYSQSGKYYSHQSSNIVLTYYDSSTPYTITLVVDSNNFNWYYTFNEQLNNNNNNNNNNTIIFNKENSNRLLLLNIVIINNAYKNYICINGKANTTFNSCVNSTIYSLYNCILDLNNCRILNNFYNNIGFDNLNNIYDYITSSIICGGNIDIKNCDNLFLGNALNNIKLIRSSYIIIGYSCNNIIIVNSIRININNYKNNITINNSDTITFEKEYMFDIIIEHNNNINITSAQTTSYSNKIQNIKINGGTNVTTTPKTISHDTVNDTFQTVYKNVNSKEVIVE